MAAPASLLAAGVPSRLANTGFVLSTSSDRDSHEWERYQAGILSHELRSALRGAADADRDGRITYAELGAFLVTANSNIENPTFRPDFTVRPPDRDLRREVLRWETSRPALRFGGAGAVADAAPSLGHVYVESARGSACSTRIRRRGSRWRCACPTSGPSSCASRATPPSWC